MTTVGDFLLQHQLHQFFGGRRHILEALPKGNDCKTHAFQVLHHLHSAPAVKGNLPNIEAFAQPLNEFLNVAVVNHIALGGLQRSLALPDIIRHMVAPNAEIEIVFWYPEVRKHHIFTVLILGREHQYEGGNICGGGQIQTSVANPAFQIILVDRERAFVPLVHGHPADGLFDPLVQAQLTESILFTGILFCRFAGILYLVDADRDAQGGVGLFPDIRVCPVVTLIRAVNHRIEGMIGFAAFQNVLGFLMNFIADGVRIVPGGGNEEIQRLHPGIAGAFGHDIVQLAVGLGVELVKYHAMGIEAVLVSHISGQHLIDAPGGLVDDALLGVENFDSLIKGGTHPHHIRSHIEHDGRLLAVSGASVDLGAFLAVPAGQQKRDGGSQFGLALLLGNLNVCGIELPIAVGLQRSEDVPDNLLLPVDQFKGLSGPGAFGVAKAFYEHHGIISSRFVVMGPLRHERGRLVFLQLAHGVTS